MKQYTAKEVGEILGLAASTIRFHINQKHIKTSVKPMERTNRPTHYISETELSRFKAAWESGVYGKSGWTKGKKRD